MPGILRSQKGNIEEAVGIFSQKVTELRDMEEKCLTRQRTLWAWRVLDSSSGSHLETQLAQNTSSYGLYKTTPLPIFQSLLMPWLLLQSHEELSVFQLHLPASKSSLCCPLANPFPGAEQISLVPWTIQGRKRQSCHILLCLICPNTFSSISKATSPVLFQNVFEAHPDLFFLTISGLRVS